MDETLGKLREVEEMSWDSLREMAVEQLSGIPPDEHDVFEKTFEVDWPQFEQMILSLAGKSYDEISPVHEKMFMLDRRRLDARSHMSPESQAEYVELAKIAMLNKTQYKSPKVQYWQICRLLHTKHK